MSVEPLKHGTCPRCHQYIYGDEHGCTFVWPPVYYRPSNDDKLAVILLFVAVICLGVGISIGVWAS